MDTKALELAKAHLMQSDEQFREMAGKHAEYSALLDAIEAKPRLSEEDVLEEHRLKKLKLRLKDEMHEIMKRHVAQTEVA